MRHARIIALAILLSRVALAQFVAPQPKSIVAYPPDGGSLVTFGNAVFPITCAQPDGGTCLIDVEGRGAVARCLFSNKDRWR